MGEKQATEETTITTELETIATAPEWVCIPVPNGHLVVQPAHIRYVFDADDGVTRVRMCDEGVGAGMSSAVFTVTIKAAEVYALLRGGA